MNTTSRTSSRGFSMLRHSTLKHFIATVAFSTAFGSYCQPLFAQQDKVDDGFKVAATDWPWWRGPQRNGQTAANQKPPTSWEGGNKATWKTPIVGRGHGSMCVVGNSVYLVSADESSGAQYAIALDRKTGAARWQTTVHATGGMRKNEKSTAASSTPACDGNRIFVSFPNSDSLVASAINLDGSIAWQTKICDYVEHQGYGASPALYHSLVIIAADNKGGGAIAALDRKSGDIVWKRDRPKLPNYPSPIIVHVAGKDQLIMTGCDKVTSYNPSTGETYWEVDGATTECVTSTLTDGVHVFTSGGYPRNHMSAVVADGSGTIAWQNDSRVYVPSLLLRNKTLFGVLDAGIAASWDSMSGKELWKNRLGGTFSASPILVNDLIYATNESGETFVFRADPTKFELISKNQLGSEVLATPVICDSKIYYRCAEEVNGKRQEFLYCLSE